MPKNKRKRTMKRGGHCGNHKNHRGSKHKNRMSMRSRRMNGGGIFPQDLVNIGNNLMYNIGGAYNTFAGYPAPVNPMPYANQFIKRI